MSEQQGIRDEMRLSVSRAVMLGAGLTKPAWTTVPVDQCQPTGEMVSVVSTDVTPFVHYLTEALMSSPVIRRIQADALRDYAARRYEAFLNHPERDWTEQPPGLAQDYARAAQSLRTEADRIEKGE